MAEQSVHAATTTPDHDGDRSHSAREGFTVAAGMASLASGAIHAAAIGVHAEHRQTALAFTVLALLQLGWGALALVRAGRLVSLAGIAVGLASVGGWVVAKTVGIGLIDGLEVAEAPQTADVVCAALAALSVVLAVLSLLPVRVESTGHSLRVPAVLGVCLLLVLTFSGMAAASSHTTTLVSWWTKPFICSVSPATLPSADSRCVAAASPPFLVRIGHEPSDPSPFPSVTSNAA